MSNDHMSRHFRSVILADRNNSSTGISGAMNAGLPRLLILVCVLP